MAATRVALPPGSLMWRYITFPAIVATAKLATVPVSFLELLRYDTVTARTVRTSGRLLCSVTEKHYLIAGYPTS